MLFIKRLFSTFILTLPFLLGSLTVHAKWSMLNYLLPSLSKLLLIKR